jgi:hypothetical protein
MTDKFIFQSRHELAPVLVVKRVRSPDEAIDQGNILPA